MCKISSKLTKDKKLSLLFYILVSNAPVGFQLGDIAECTQSFIEREPLLALLSTDKTSGNEEGSEGQQMMPGLINKVCVFSESQMVNAMKNPTAPYC